MYYKISILISFLVVFAAKAISQVPDHIPLLNKYWELLDTKSSRPNKYGINVVYFPPPLAAMNNKTIELSGYMVPMFSGLKHKIFLLSVLPVLQCQFCGQAGVPEMVYIELVDAIPYTDSPLNIRGTLILNGADDSQPSFRLINATTGFLK